MTAMAEFAEGVVMFDDLNNHGEEDLVALTKDTDGRMMKAL
jgi:hypothetical protein